MESVVIHSTNIQLPNFATMTTVTRTLVRLEDGRIRLVLGSMAKAKPLSQYPNALTFPFPFTWPPHRASIYGIKTLLGVVKVEFVECTAHDLVERVLREILCVETQGNSIENIRQWVLKTYDFNFNEEKNIALRMLDKVFQTVQNSGNSSIDLSSTPKPQPLPTSLKMSSSKPKM